MSKRKYSYIDLFSGSGGFSLGFDEAGFENVFSVEFDHDICETYRHNFPSHCLGHRVRALVWQVISVAVSLMTLEITCFKNSSVS